MKKKLIVFLLLPLLAVSVFADSFTDAIQDLAFWTACIGKYNMKEAGYAGKAKNFYEEEMIDFRLAEESGDMTRTLTFFGVCFDYAQFAYNYVERNLNYYKSKGLYERQFWMAGDFDDNTIITLQYPSTKDDPQAIMTGNGVWVRRPNNCGRHVKAHDGATKHAWLWIERADGVQFWIDPTWTDEYGYVFYGYVKNGEEIQCRPNKDLCINYPSYLDTLPLPPAMGARKAPSKTANSTNREETINDAGTDWLDTVMRKTFIDVDYGFKKDYIALLASASVPFSSITGKSISADKMGFALEIPFLYDSIAMVIGLEYLHNLDEHNRLHGGLFELDFTRRLLKNVAWYIGGGVGLRFDFSNEYGAPAAQNGLVDTGYFAWKADTGFVINISSFFTKVEVSYDNVIGFAVGAGIGLGLEL